MRKLIIWGAGGHAKVVLDVARAMGEFAEIVLLDDDVKKRGTLFCECPIAGDAEQLPFLAKRDYRLFVAAIGENRTRARCYQRAVAQGFTPVTLVHPAAVISPSAGIGRGTVIMPRAVVNANARVGENVIVNTAAVIEHDCVIGDHVHVSPGAIAAGGTRIGAYAQLGLSAVLLPGTEVGEGAMVGAGAVVLESVPPGVTAVGVPARILERAGKMAAYAEEAVDA